MKIEFRDKRIALIRTDRAAETKLPFAVIKSAREKLVLLEAAPDERTLRNWKSLHYKTLEGDRGGEPSIRVNDQWRIAFTIDETSMPPTVTVLAVDDHH